MLEKNIKQLNRVSIRVRVSFRVTISLSINTRAGLKCESAKMTTSKMRNKLRNIFRILDVAIFALSHIALSHF